MSIISAKKRTKPKPKKPYTLDVVLIGKTARCVYINDFRVVGGKPYLSENSITKSFAFDIADLRKAFPDLNIEEKSDAKTPD